MKLSASGEPGAARSKRRRKKHAAVRDYILGGIRDGRWPPGTKIPTEQAIMRDSASAAAP